MNDTIAVKDFLAAATLKASGIQFVGTEPGHRVALVFDNTDGKADDLLAKHRNGGVPLNSAQFTGAYHFVKDVIFSSRD